jgi:hypothetical protein
MLITILAPIARSVSVLGRAPRRWELLVEEESTQGVIDWSGRTPIVPNQPDGRELTITRWECCRRLCAEGSSGSRRHERTRGLNRTSTSPAAPPRKRVLTQQRGTALIPRSKRAAGLEPRSAGRTTNPCLHLATEGALPGPSGR